MQQKEKIIYGADEDTRIRNGELVYDPVAGLLIQQALAQAILMAKKHKQHVHAIINDVHMHITDKTSLKRAHTAYQRENDARWKAALRECQRKQSQH